jgi:hypothetical protein
MPTNDSASFPFRFIDVHAGAVRDRHREQFFEVPGRDIAETGHAILHILATKQGSPSWSDLPVELTASLSVVNRGTAEDRHSERDDTCRSLASSGAPSCVRPVMMLNGIWSYYNWTRPGAYASGCDATRFRRAKDNEPMPPADRQPSVAPASAVQDERAAAPGLFKRVVARMRGR